MTTHFPRDPCGNPLGCTPLNTCLSCTYREYYNILMAAEQYEEAEAMIQEYFRRMIE
jgi:hypothetical protein